MNAALKRTPPAFFSWIRSCLSTAFPKLVSSGDTALNDTKRSEAKGQGYASESNKNTNPKSHLWSVDAAIFITPHNTKHLDGTDNLAIPRLSTNNRTCWQLVLVQSQSDI